MANSNKSDLDWQVVLKNAIDGSEEAMRMVLAESQGIAIELSESDGDSIATRSLVASSSAVLDSSDSTGVLIAEFASEGYKELQLISKLGSTITGTGTVKIEFSPAASGDIWIDSGVSLAVTGSSDQISSIANPIAKRVRANLSANTISSGSATIYLMARG